MKIQYIRKLSEKYEELSTHIESRWRELIGFGCGYFDSWTLSGDYIYVYYERPSRQGGGIGHPDKIPLKCFEVDTIKEAKQIFKDSE